MIAKTQKQQMITLIGWLKTNVMSKTSVNGDGYFSAAMEISEMKRENQIINNNATINSNNNANNINNKINEPSKAIGNSIMLIFWKKNFNEKTQRTISKLSEGSRVTVHGYIGGKDGGLLRVVMLETDESEMDDEESNENEDDFFI